MATITKSYPDTEKEYYEKFKQKLPGFYDDGEWWKLVESADQPPAEELPECPVCGAQNLKEAEECVACGAILKPKTCVNEKCGKIIPLSAVTCPFCGANQIPTVLEPGLVKYVGLRILQPMMFVRIAAVRVELIIRFPKRNYLLTRIR